MSHPPPPNLDIEDIIPHRPPMKLIDEVVAIDGDSATVCSTARTEWPLCSERGIPSVIGIELIAQAAAVVVGWQNRDESGFKGGGMLVGIKGATIYVDPIMPGDQLETQISRKYGKGLYAVFQGQVKRGEELIASAEIQVMIQ